MFSQVYGFIIPTKNDIISTLNSFHIRLSFFLYKRYNNSTRYGKEKANSISHNEA